MIKKIHEESPDKGYRRIRDDLERYHETKVNDKRVLRICRNRDIKSTIKYSDNGCTRQADNPYYIAENLLNREFKADAPNKKWLTDVTEFHYYIGIEKRKVYLSAILDLLIPLTLLQNLIPMLVRYFTVTEVFNIQAGYFVQR